MLNGFEVSNTTLRTGDNLMHLKRNAEDIPRRAATCLKEYINIPGLLKRSHTQRWLYILTIRLCCSKMKGYGKLYMWLHLGNQALSRDKKTSFWSDDARSVRRLVRACIFCNICTHLQETLFSLSAQSKIHTWAYLHGEGWSKKTLFCYSTNLVFPDDVTFKQTVFLVTLTEFV